MREFEYCNSKPQGGDTKLLIPHGEFFLYSKLCLESKMKFAKFTFFSKFEEAFIIINKRKMYFWTSTKSAQPILSYSGSSFTRIPVG